MVWLISDFITNTLSSFVFSLCISRVFEIIKNLKINNYLFPLKNIKINSIKFFEFLQKCQKY
jgi:hypothetical protein